MTLEPGAGPTLRSYIRLVLRRKWWVMGLALLGVSASLAISLTQPRQYASTAQVLVQSPTGPGALSGTPQQVTPTEVQTMLQLVTSAAVQSQVRQRLGSTPPVEAAEVAQTNVISISAVSGVPANAALVANTYARAFVSTQQSQALKNATSAETQLRSQIRATAQQIAKLRKSAHSSSEVNSLVNQEAVLRVQLSQIQVSGAAAASALALVNPALPPTSPSSPRPVTNGLLGLAAGLILGMAAAFLRDSLDDAVSSKEAVEHLTGAPVLAAVPMVTSWRKRDRPLVVTLARPAAPATEAYRSLRTSLQFARQEHELRTILVTSPAAAEGKTSTLANLGAVFAQAGQHVLMVSCDLRKPRLGQFFGIDESRGLTTAVLGEDSLENLVKPTPGSENLWLLPSGPTPPNPAELLNGARSQEILARLRDAFDLVLIDSPPVLPVTDAMVLSKDVDATLLVVAAFRTSSADVLRAAEKLGQVDARVVGVVLNEATRQGAGYYAAGYSRPGYYGPALAELPPGGAVPGPGAVPAQGVAARTPAAATGARNGSSGGSRRKARGAG
jgi:capsular exopolysaccharide synthesis family protein